MRTYFFVSGLVTNVIRDAEIFIVVAAPFEPVDFVGAHSEMEVQYLLLFAGSNFLLDALNISICIFGGNFNGGTLQAWYLLFSEVFRDQFCRVDRVVSELFEASEVDLIKHDKN